jgi:hypothetical protein
VTIPGFDDPAHPWSQDNLERAWEDDVLSADVLLELGRLTFAVLRLEDTAQFMAGVLDDRARREPDKRPIGTKITEALEHLASSASTPGLELANAWLEGAQSALTLRNQTLHAGVMFWAPLPGTPSTSPPMLIYTDRDTGETVSTTDLTVEALCEVTSEIDGAERGWREVTATLRAELATGDGSA